MKIIVTDNYEKLSETAYAVIKNIVLNTPNPILGLATGSTPLGLYKCMVEDYKKGEVSYKNVRTTNLDEYVGLPKEHDQSYYYFMHHNLFDLIDIPSDATNLPCGTATDMKEECNRYNKLLESMPRDIQLLGIGNNGHIAFNEPNTKFDSVTHTVKLTPSTIQANARFFASEKEVPTMAISMGIKNIMDAKSILLVATGTNKAQAIADALEGEVDEKCPASILQRHPNVTVVIDKDAAKKLKF